MSMPSVGSGDRKASPHTTPCGSHVRPTPYPMFPFDVARSKNLLKLHFQYSQGWGGLGMVTMMEEPPSGYFWLHGGWINRIYAAPNRKEAPETLFTTKKPAMTEFDTRICDDGSNVAMHHGVSTSTICTTGVKEKFRSRPP